MTPSLTWAQILALKPCKNDRDAAREALTAALPDYRTRPLTIADAAGAGVSLDALIWLAGKASEADADCARRLRLFAADCAARVSHLAPDPRSRAAIVAARRYARGEIDADALWTAWDAAWDAARDAARDAAWDAAWAAAWDAAWAAARTAARIAARIAAWDAAWAAERSWQLDRLIQWFSDNEPTDYPITEEEKAA